MYLRIDAYQIDFTWQVVTTLDPYFPGEDPSVKPVIRELTIPTPDYDPSDPLDVVRELIRAMAEIA